MTESKKDIYSFWVHYTTKNEEEYFRKFIAGLVAIWENQLDMDWASDETIPESKSILPDVGPPLSRLPEELLPAIGKFLYVTKDKVDTEIMSNDELVDAELLVRTLIIISRNFGNIPAVAANDYVQLIVSISSNVMLKILQHEMEDTLDKGISFCTQCAHLLESLYDPYLTWRYFRKTNSLAEGIPHAPKASPAALLHIEIVPFIFEYFEQKISEIAPALAFELLNVLGGIISGSRKNAMTGVCPATASLLAAVVSNASVNLQIRLSAVRCFVIMIYNMLTTEPYQRQIEVSTLLELYRGCVSNVIVNMKDLTSNQENERSVFCGMVDMLSTLISLSDDDYVARVKCVLVQNFVLECILDALEKMEASNDVAYSCFSTIAHLIKNEVFSKERMMKISGYQRIFRKLKLIENLDLQLLTILIEMTIEEKYENGKFHKLKNPKLIIFLLELLPSLETRNQEWLSSIILSVCSCNLQCKWKAIKCGTLQACCETLSKYKALASATIDQLINLIETLASISVTTSELKRIFNLFLISNRKLCPFYLRLLQVLSNITRSNNFVKCRSYFDLQSNSNGIRVPEIKKWPGSIFGFTFHSWISLNKLDSGSNGVAAMAGSSYRRQIFSLYTANKQGIQINMNADNNLVIIISTKKDFIAISLFDFTFEENRWYCLDICYMPSKRPFAQNQITIYIDGIQQLVATAKFAHISDNFTWCTIGAPIDDIQLETNSSGINSQNASETERNTGLLPSFISHVPSYITLPLRSSSNVNPYVKSFPLGMQTTIFGPEIALYGQIGNVSLFQEPLTTAHVRLLYETGINDNIFSNIEENQELSNLQSKLVFSYSPLACAFDCVVDLCSKYKIDGRTTASICCVHCLKENINSIGGVNVFLPFFETIDYSSNEEVLFFQQNISVEDYSDMTESVVSNFRNVSEVHLEESPVAVIIVIMKNLLKEPINQEYFLKRYGFAMLGNLLVRVSVKLVDLSVLLCVCILAETINSSKNTLCQRTFYQNVLFNFDIWSRCNFEVQQGHVQFLQSFIKKDKKFFKKRFGVQFMLDVIRKYLSNDDLTNLEAIKTVRAMILSMINYYMQKEVNIGEINAIVSYVICCQQEFQIVEIVELLVNHLQNKFCTDQLYLLLYEQNTADLFYSLLINPNFGTEMKKTILRLFSVLLRTNRVYERSKHRLQLQDHTDIGLCPGLMMSFPDNHIVAVDVALSVLDQMFIAENNSCYAGALVLLSRLTNAPLIVKLEAARKILIVVFMKPEAPKFFAKQIGWDDCIARLLIRKPIVTSSGSTTESVPQSESLAEKKATDASKVYPSLLKDVTSFLEKDLKGATDAVNSLVTDNIQLAASNLTSAAENVSLMVAENIHFAADNITSVAENVTTAVADNITFVAENISSVVGSAYSLITQKSVTGRNIPSPSGLEPKSFSSSSQIDNSFTLVNFDDLSLGNRSYSNESIDEMSLGNRSRSSYSNNSPSHISKDSISLTSIQSGSNYSEENDDERVLFDVLNPWTVMESEKEENTEEELCNAVITVLFTIMWKGYDLSDKSAWKNRGQVLACMNMLGLNNELYCSYLKLKLKLLEMIAQATLDDFRNSVHNTSSDLHHVRVEDARQLLHWIYDLVEFDSTHSTSKKLSVKLFNCIVELLEATMTFREDPAEERADMVKVSFSLLLKNAAMEDLELCAVAAAKLHAIIQTRRMSDMNEACYILYLLNEIVTSDLKKNNLEHYSFMVPVMKTLITKLSDKIFAMEEVLLKLNIKNPGFAFYESFQELNVDSRWIDFVENKVKPNFEKYKNSLASELSETMNIFWAECYEAYKASLQKSNKLVIESTRRFQDVIYNPFLMRREEEQQRYQNVLSQYRNHRILLKKKWKVQKNYLIGARRAWKDSLDQHEIHWRLSHHENFSRMRFKLIPNLHFDSHKDASSLRDNMGWAKARLSDEITLPLSISQMALRKESDYNNEQSADIELTADKLEENDLENKTEIPHGTEKLLVSCDCELVTLMSVIKGKIEVTNYNVYFHDSSPVKEECDRYDFRWSMNKLREMYLRRYNLRKTALEFFLTDQTNYFLNFEKETRSTVYTTIIRLRPPNLFHSYKSPCDIFKSSDLMQKWINREISNFDYLMQLNTIAGRTYNDLSQYPVFPWILADYESDELDFNNPASFRDLSKPIGVVNPDNEIEVRNRYNTFEDPGGIIAKFHYGTHYSNSAGVLHYMVRVEPFTTLHIDLQSGRFDVADRQFHSIPQTWKLLMENPNDVKELIPEFFYFPEFLKNINKFDLGTLQGTKEKVDDVILPKWATSPEDFIYKHRKALESEYVSSHLHEWIDLIFGWKQRGSEAIKALNVFYYCSYEGAVDLDAITDPTEREAVEGMINNFGQIPSQLLKEPHPPRLSLSKALTRMLEWNAKKADFTLFFDHLSHFQVPIASDRDPVVFANSPRSIPKGFLSSSVPDAMITVSRNGYVGMHSWSPHDRHSSKGFSITVDESVNNTKWRRDLTGSFHPSIKLQSKLFVVSHDNKLLFSAGHWDYSIKVYSLTKNRHTQSLLKHTDIVTCLALDSCGWYLISGSRDCTSIVWNIGHSVHPPKPYQLLHGHDEPITCVSIATELDTAVSGSLDGTVNVYTIHEGYLVHTLTPEGCASPVADITFVTVSVQGHIVFSASDKINHSIHVYSINGVNLGSKYVLGQVTGLITISDYVVVTDDAGDLTISRLLGLHPMYNVPLHIPIQSVVSTNGNTHLLVPLRDGHLVVIGIPNNIAYLQK